MYVPMSLKGSKLKTLSKNLYYTSKFDECQKDARKVWNVIRSTFPNSKPIKDTPDLLVTDRGTTSDYQNIADEFNKFFCSIGSNLANNFSNTSFKSFSTYLTKRVSSSIYLNIPNRTEIFNAIYSLKNNRAIGHDDITAFFLRIASLVIIPYLQVFIEFCFTEGGFFKNCTIARIVPIFKKGERDKPTNYHPIFVLTCFSKIFEGLLYKRINNFLNKHNVIINSQCGFQNKVSTNHAFVDVIIHSYDNINSNQYTGLVFLDLTKAFDSVNHDILLLKLDHYGIRGSTNN